MSEKKSKKKYVSMWIKEDKNGQPFLSGKDKESGIKYFVFTDKAGNKVLKTSDNSGVLIDVGTLNKASNDYGEYLTVGGMFVSENNFFDAADPFMKRKGGEYVLDSAGEKIAAPEYQIAIPLEA